MIDNETLARHGRVIDTLAKQLVYMGQDLKAIEASDDEL